METISRRTFIRGAVSIAAGAAAGLTVPGLGLAASKGIREYAPVEIGTYFLSTDPIIIQGAIYADDRQDVFGIRVFDKGEEFGRAELRLSTVKEIAASFKMVACRVIAQNEHGKTERFNVGISVRGGNLLIHCREQNHSSTPLWVSLADVRRVL